MHRHHHYGKREYHSRYPYSGYEHAYRRGGDGGRTRGRRFGKFLEHGDLRFVLLGLLAEKPRHGYELMRELEERTGGAYRPSPGVIYPTMSLLEDEGFIRPVAPDAGRKAFEITDAGRQALEANRPAVDAIFARFEEAQAQTGGARPRLQRAMQNLGSALNLRLQSGEVSEAQLDAIVAAIDEAATKVEKA